MQKNINYFQKYYDNLLVFFLSEESKLENVEWNRIKDELQNIKNHIRKLEKEQVTIAVYGMIP